MSMKEFRAIRFAHYFPQFLSLSVICLISLFILTTSCSPKESGPQDQSNVEDVDALISSLAEGKSIEEDVEKLINIGESAVEPLIEALKDPQESMRKRAAYVLGEIGDTRAVDPLIEAFQLGTIDGYALDAIRKIGDPRAVEVAVITLVEEDQYDTIAEKIISDLGTQSAEPWIDLLENSNPEVRIKAVQILWLDYVNEDLVGDKTLLIEALLRMQIQWDGSIETEDELHFSRGVIEAMGSTAISPLIALLEGEDEHLRFPAAYALGRIGGPEAAEALVSALANSDYMTSLAGFWGLNQWQWGVESEATLVSLDRGFNNLVAHMQNPDLKEYERADAVKLIAKVDDPRSVQVLMDALDNDDPENPVSAIVYALGELGDPVAIPLLTELLNDESGKIQVAALTALGMIGGEHVLDLLIDALQDKDSEVRQAALSSLNKMDDEDLAPLLDAIETGDLEMIARAYRFFISRGQSGWERYLMDALIAYGDVGMAGVFLNSGHAPLEDAARRWAAENGYTIFEITIPDVGDRSGKWGSGN